MPNKLKDEEFISELKRAAAKGHELALHGVDHFKNEFGVLYPIPLSLLPIPTFKKQRQRLEKGVKTMVEITGIKPVGFRAPYLLYSNATLRALSSLGFRYDSSISLFKPSHSSRFRIGWSQKIKPFFSNGILEICVSGDYTFKLSSNNFHHILGKAINDFKQIASHEGVFVLNNHPKRFSQVESLSLKFSKKKFRRTLISTDFAMLPRCFRVKVNNSLHF